MTPDGTIPTFFANPFRSFAAGRLVPLTAMQRCGIECTLLRSNEVDNASPPAAPPANARMLFESRMNDRYNQSDRNPYFRYASLQRLGNLVTTRSNVYAVWITAGYFEVEPDPTNDRTLHPDGYRLAQELGSDTGDVKRHRGFYVIDRSIPVAFEPGVNHNVDRAVVLRRFIE